MVSALSSETCNMGWLWQGMFHAHKTSLYICKSINGPHEIKLFQISYLTFGFSLWSKIITKKTSTFNLKCYLLFKYKLRNLSSLKVILQWTSTSLFLLIVKLITYTTEICFFSINKTFSSKICLTGLNDKTFRCSSNIVENKFVRFLSSVLFKFCKYCTMLSFFRNFQCNFIFIRNE